MKKFLCVVVSLVWALPGALGQERGIGPDGKSLAPKDVAPFVAPLPEAPTAPISPVTHFLLSLLAALVAAAPAVAAYLQSRANATRQQQAEASTAAIHATLKDAVVLLPTPHPVNPAVPVSVPVPVVDRLTALVQAIQGQGKGVP